MANKDDKVSVRDSIIDAYARMEEYKKRNSQPVFNPVDTVKPRDIGGLREAVSAFLRTGLPIDQITPFVDDYYTKYMLDR